MKCMRAVYAVVFFMTAISIPSLAQQEHSETWFGPQKMIDRMAKEAYDVHAADLNGDGDEDILSAARVSHRIAWYENTGQDSAGKMKVINDNLEFPTHVIATDLDGDGRVDVLGASNLRETVAILMNAGDDGFAGPPV